MNNTANQFIESSKSSVEAFEGLASQAFASVEKLVELNMATTKAALGDTFSQAKAVLGAKDAQEALALQSALLKPLTEKTTAYAQSVQSIVTSSGADFSKTVEAKSAEAQKAFTGVIENLVKSAPAGSESAVAAFKSALTAGQNALETAQSATKKAVEAAQTNFTAAATQASDAVKKATKSA